MTPLPFSSASRRRIAAMVAATLVGAAVQACGHSSDATAPVTEQVCGAGGVVTVPALGAATLDCSSGGTMVQLAGNGATYLVVPQFAAGNVSKAAIAYTIGAANTVAASVQAQRSAPSESGVGVASSPETFARMARSNSLQMRFDASLRLAERAAVSSGRWNFFGSASGSFSRSIRRSVQPGGLPAPGSLRDFRVISSLDPNNPNFVTVSARLLYTGANILIYIDTLAPANGFSTDQLNGFGQLFDQTLYAIDVAAFGPPSDIDGNSRLIVLLSPTVNSLTPAAQCASQGFIAGFFDGFDLSSTSTNSNQGEIYFGLVPDPGATVSCTHSVSSLLNIAPATFLHELQHLINFSQHAIARGGAGEEGWLDEGLSLVAEELGSIYYEQRFPPPSGRTNPNQLFPDSSQGFINGLLFDSYKYLLKTDTTTVTLHSDADGGLNWRGGDWLLLRWLGDQKGANFYKLLEQSSLTGTRNIAAAAGESFQSLFGDFSLSLYTDSIVGVAKSSIPARDRFNSRTLRRMYQALFNAAGPSADVPRAFPIVTTPLTGTISASMVPGTMSFYTLTAPASSATITVRFKAAGGGALPAGMHPQLSVFRLP
ncbi:MAG: hypothetical protein M3081_04615 [Gemmatimonadota bacterium]|nr:hypothetical protein [Gemmatimonadota bacterium]